MKVRLADLAARAGVSISTVSRVLNDKPGVNEETRQSVLTALDVLGYERPAKLRARNAGLVGLVMPELENPFFPRFAEQLEMGLAQIGYTPVLCTHTLGGIHEDEYVATLLDHGVSGIVFVSGVHAVTDSDPSRYRRLTEHGLPTVLVNGYQGGVGAACLATDDHAMSDLAVAHLAHMGHTRIGLAVGQERYTPAARRAAGFAEAMRRHVDPGLDDAAIASLIRYTTYSVTGGAQAALELIGEGVTGIVCGSDMMALGVLRAARQRGVLVPRDLSVVGADDSTLIEFVDPPLTTVRQPAAALASAVCRVLSESIAGAGPPDRELLFAPELVVRQSSARVPRP